MDISAHPRVNCVTLERFVDFGMVRSHTENEVVREKPIFPVYFEKALQDVVDS